jgi:MoaA/NifB/PqqE/SkfB family radical SAM enzyme
VSVAALEVVYFGLFDDCNAKCNMCACWRLPRSSRDVAHFRSILDRVLQLRPRAIRFTGGEPLLLPGLPELVRRAAAAGARVSVISNGRLLATKVDSLVTAGCDEFVLSLDGAGEAHDRIRGTAGLYRRCLAAIDAIARTGVPYGVNTVVQRIGVDDIPVLADLFLSRSKPPAWWHLIPVHDHSDLRPTDEQIAALQSVLPTARQQLAAAGIAVVGDAEMFDTHGAVACTVPTFAAYVRADTGEMYGCNMLAYAGGRLGNLHTEPPIAAWRSDLATELRERCLAGTNTACVRCDPSSRDMNHTLRRMARQHQNGATNR